MSDHPGQPAMVDAQPFQHPDEENEYSPGSLVGSPNGPMSHQTSMQTGRAKIFQSQWTQPPTPHFIITLIIKITPVTLIIPPISIRRMPLTLMPLNLLSMIWMPKNAQVLSWSRN